MDKILGIDYGAKRTGIAITDSMQLIASGLNTVFTKELFFYLKKIILKEKIKIIVIGLPKNFNNKIFSIENEIKKFIKNLNKIYPFIKIVRIDERFTSKIAFNSVIKLKNKKNRSILDIISATIILQSYLEKIKKYDYTYNNL